MKTPSPYDEHPYYGRYDGDHAHAHVMIVRSLIELGLADWTATLLHWLGRYDGLEMHLGEGFDPDPRLDPLLCVRDVLLDHVMRWPRLKGRHLTREEQRQRIEAVTHDLLDLEFVTTRASWTGGKDSNWNPLDQDWLSFIQMGPDLAALQQMPDADDAEKGLLDVWTSPGDLDDRNRNRLMLLGEFCAEGAGNA